jgi:hypothetical protein
VEMRLVQAAESLNEVFFIFCSSVLIFEKLVTGRSETRPRGPRSVACRR